MTLEKAMAIKSQPGWKFIGESERRDLYWHRKTGAVLWICHTITGRGDAGIMKVENR